MAAASKRTIAITGASSGLGAGLAEAYAGTDVRLALIARDGARLEAVAERCRAKGAEVLVSATDVTDAQALSVWLCGVDAGGAIDLLVAAAGVSAGTRLDGSEEDAATARRVIDVNLVGMINTVAPVLAAMRGRRKGHLALIGSLAGYRGLADSPAYAASKAAVRIYAESLRGAVAADNIAVTIVIPGFFRSPMSDRYIGAKPFSISLERAVSIVRDGLEVRRPRIGFPRRLALLLRIADLLPARLGDFIIGHFRFRIAA